MIFSGSVRLLENLELGNDNYLGRFDAPEIGGATRPAQFVMLRVGDGSDPLLGRPFSVARIGRGSRGETVDLLYKVQGRGTALLAGLQPGAMVHMVGPLGCPFPEPPSPDQQILLVAGGIGIAPFPILADFLGSRSTVTRLLFGARTARDLIGRDLLEASGVAIEVATDDGSEGHHGTVTQLLDNHLEQLSEEDRRLSISYVCGPTAMMAAADEILAHHGAGGHFSVESFMGCGFGVCLSCVVPVRDQKGEEKGYARICVDGPTFPAGRVVWSRSVAP